MAGAKEIEEARGELSELYKRLELTSEQKAAARAEAERRAREARRNGAYERLRELVGKVHLSIDVEALREDRD